MAGFSRINGDAQPVFHTDVQSSVVPTAPADNTPINFIGPAMDFFGIDLGANPVNEMGIGEAISTVVNTIQQITNIAIYQVSPTGDATNLSVAVYPKGEWSAANLQAQIQGLGILNGYDFSTATVTNVGFRLATTGILPS